MTTACSSRCYIREVHGLCFRLLSRAATPTLLSCTASGAGRHLHASGLCASGWRWQLPGLVLPLPRLPLRWLRPHPRGPSTIQPGGAHDPAASGTTAFRSSRASAMQTHACNGMGASVSNHPIALGHLYAWNNTPASCGHGTMSPCHQFRVVTNLETSELRTCLSSVIFSGVTFSWVPME